MSVLLACAKIIEEQLRKRAIKERLRSLGKWPPATQEILPPHALDPDIIREEQKRRAQGNTAKAQLTPEQRAKIDECRPCYRKNGRDNVNQITLEVFGPSKNNKSSAGKPMAKRADWDKVKAYLLAQK
jgi:hypothetical protein